MRVTVFLIVAISLGFLTRHFYRSILIEIHGIWRPIGTSEEPYLEIHRLDGSTRHNFKLELADRIWAVQSEGNEATATWWQERRSAFAKETRS